MSLSHKRFLTTPARIGRGSKPEPHNVRIRRSGGATTRKESAGAAGAGAGYAACGARRSALGNTAGAVAARGPAHGYVRPVRSASCVHTSSCLHRVPARATSGYVCILLITVGCEINCCDRLLMLPAACRARSVWCLHGNAISCVCRLVCPKTCQKQVGQTSRNMGSGRPTRLVRVHAKDHSAAPQGLVLERRRRIVVRLRVPQRAACHPDALVLHLSRGHLHDDLIPRNVALLLHALLDVLADVNRPLLRVLLLVLLASELRLQNHVDNLLHRRREEPEVKGRAQSAARRITGVRPRSYLLLVRVRAHDVRGHDNLDNIAGGLIVRHGSLTLMKHRSLKTCDKRKEAGFTPTHTPIRKRRVRAYPGFLPTYIRKKESHESTVAISLCDTSSVIPQQDFVDGGKL